MFGGSLTHNAGSSGVAEKNLNRWTIIIGLTRFLVRKPGISIPGQGHPPDGDACGT